MEKAGEITKLLDDWRHGDPKALDQLMQLIYDELRQLASAYLRRERPDHTLQTTALVHEAFLRLVGQQHVEWQNRAHFYGIAARMMRRLLANHARDRLAAKRRGSARHLSLDETVLPPEEVLAETLAVDDALKSLAAIRPQQAEVVELRYFGGLTSEEIAEVLGISVPTVARRWRVARAWLYRSLKAERSLDPSMVEEG